MTQLGEPLAVGEVFDHDWECPFPHGMNVPPADNDLKGVGTTLGSRMKVGRGTVTRSELPGHTVSAVPGPAFIADEPIQMDGEKYPLTLAAHHLIPAQESLKGCPILEYIDKAKGIVKENLGYDVNGTQNGIWLPGPYAVEGWGDMTLEAEDLPEKAARPATQSKRRTALPAKLKGNLFQGNYAFSAQELCRCQFHDRHENYSDWVRNYLEKVHVNLMMVEVAHCPQCRERQEKLAPPLALLKRLNGLSAKLAAFLAWGPARWREPLFTSAWSAFLRAAVRPGNYDGN